jgi:hypothetical protein
MSILELSPLQARALLATFNKPCQSEFIDSSIEYKGRFNSNSDYMNSPVVWGGYVQSDDGVEITIGWTDIEGMKDETPYMFCGYSFETDGVRNWMQAAKATRDHLKEIIENE